MARSKQKTPPVLLPRLRVVHGDVIPFGLSLNGVADQFSNFGDGQAAAVFMERTTATGFYSVAIKIIDLTPEF